jgi:hypothetical protein
VIPFEAVELQPKDTRLKPRLLAHHEDVPQGPHETLSLVSVTRS